MRDFFLFGKFIPVSHKIYPEVAAWEYKTMAVEPKITIFPDGSHRWTLSPFWVKMQLENNLPIPHFSIINKEDFAPNHLEEYACSLRSTHT